MENDINKHNAERDLNARQNFASLAEEQLLDFMAGLADDGEIDDNVYDVDFIEEPIREEEEEMPIATLHEYLEDIDEERTEEDIKSLPLVVRLGILGAKIREDPTSWFYFCANKNSAEAAKRAGPAYVKDVHLTASNSEEAIEKIKQKADSIERSVKNESENRTPFSAVAKLAIQDKAYIDNSFNEVVRTNCLRIVSEESRIEFDDIPFPVSLLKSSQKFPFEFDRFSITHEGLRVPVDSITDYDSPVRNRRYIYFRVDGANSCGQDRVSNMFKHSRWPSLLWREKKKGVQHHHYLLPRDSPATFKTWMFLQQYNHSSKKSHKIDKFSLQNYFTKFEYKAIDLNNWGGAHSERKNLDGTEVCSRYRQKYFKNGKYQEPDFVPQVKPRAACKLSTCPCTCFIYPAELMERFRIAVEVIREDDVFKKKPCRIGKMCFYCTTRYYGEKCGNPDHSKRMLGFVKDYSTKYNVSATVKKSACVDCPLIIRVSKDSARKPLVGNELLVADNFFKSVHWEYIQAAYANSTIYIAGGSKKEVSESVKQEYDPRIEFLDVNCDLKGIACPANKCDKLTSLYLNQKIASIIGSTFQPLQYQDGFILTMIPIKTASKIMAEALETAKSTHSVDDPHSETSFVKDHCKFLELRDLRQAKMLFGQKRKDTDDAEDEVRTSKSAKIENNELIME